MKAGLCNNNGEEENPEKANYIHVIKTKIVISPRRFPLISMPTHCVCIWRNSWAES